jgi:hypothetical protein
LAEPACVINRQRCAHLVSGPFTELDHGETVRVSYFEGRVSGGLQSWRGRPQGQLPSTYACTMQGPARPYSRPARGRVPGTRP